MNLVECLKNSKIRFLQVIILFFRLQETYMAVPGTVRLSASEVYEIIRSTYESQLFKYGSSVQDTSYTCSETNFPLRPCEETTWHFNLHRTSGEL